MKYTIGGYGGCGFKDGEWNQSINDSKIGEWLNETASPKESEWEAAYHKLFALYQPLREKADEVESSAKEREIAFAEWIRTFDALEKKDGHWVLESQVSSEKLWTAWQQSQTNKL